MVREREREREKERAEGQSEQLARHQLLVTCSLRGESKPCHIQTAEIRFEEINVNLDEFVMRSID